MQAPDKHSVGRYWRDRDGVLWLQEYGDDVVVSLLRADAPFDGRRAELAGDTSLGLELMREPILRTLQEERQ